MEVTRVSPTVLRISSRSNKLVKAIEVEWKELNDYLESTYETNWFLSGKILHLDQEEANELIWQDQEKL